MFILTFAAAIGSGLVAGVFFAFSSFIMSALGRLPAQQGIAAMQSICITVINLGFMLALFGTAVLGLVLTAGSFSQWGQPRQILLVLAAVFYAVGCIGVTMVCNVPLNNALVAVQSDSGEAVTLWARYLKEWTFWNHVRTVASAITCALYIAAVARLSAD
jgi:uncharacterized membrane protein